MRKPRQLRDTMLPLVPDPRAFTAAHLAWLQDVSDLIVRAQAGTTFGLYGRWGSGKSSAVLALVPTIYAAARKRDRVAQVVVVDTTALRGSVEDTEAVARAINEEVSFESSSRVEFAALRKKAFKAVSIFSKALSEAPDPVVKVGAHSLDVLSSLGAAHAAAAQDRAQTQISDSPELDQIVVVFDDLDRCPPDVAIRVLQTAVTPTLRDLATTIVVCDPGVLAAHAAAIFGVPSGDGLRAVAKYVHVAIHIPARIGASAEESFAKYVPSDCLACGELVNSARIAAEHVPIRDVLTALPQASLWIRAVQRSRSPSRELCETLVALSILSTSLPQIFEILQRAPKTLFRDLLQEFFKEDVLKRASRFRWLVGEHLMLQLRQRMDLIEVGRALGKGEIDPDTALVVLAAINGSVPAGL